MKAIICMVVVLSLFSCNKTTTKVEATLLKSEPFLTEDYVFGNAREMMVNAKWLIVEDTRVDYLFHIFDLKTRKLVHAFGEKGQGPDEFLFPTRMYALSDTSFCTMDANKRVFYEFQYSEKNDSVRVIPVFQSNEVMHLSVMPVKGKGYVTRGVYPEAHYYLLDSLGNIQQNYAAYPYRDDTEKGLSKSLLSQVYTGAMATNRSRDKFVKAPNDGKMLLFYRINNGRIEPIKEVIERYPEYKYKDGVTSYSGLSRLSPFGFVDVTADDKYVYALYSGKTYQEEDIRAFYGDVVYVYDWEGNQHRTFTLDKLVTQLKLSEDSQTLYAVAQEPEIHIVQFHLPTME